MFTTYINPTDGRLHVVADSFDIPLVQDKSNTELYFKFNSKGNMLYVSSVKKELVEKSPIEGFNPSMKEPRIAEYCEATKMYTSRFHKEGLKSASITDVYNSLQAKTNTF